MPSGGVERHAPNPGGLPGRAPARFGATPTGQVTGVDIDHSDGSADRSTGLSAAAGAGLGALSEELASARGPAAAAENPSNGAGPAAAETRPGATGPAAAPSVPHRFAGPARLHALADAIGQWLARPPVRLALMGVLLLAIAGLFLANSFWTLPLVIVGVLMVLIAWVGSRLNGHFVVEWGESGTQVQFRARITPARHRHGTGVPRPSPNGSRAGPGAGDPAA